MLPEQKTTFESMAISSAFDDEGTEQQDSLWTIWYLTPRVFEKEAEDKATHEAQHKALLAVERKASQEAEQAMHGDENGESPRAKSSTSLPGPFKPPPKETVVANWDPELYRSKFFRPVTCLFGASFGALHLISWNTEFPSQVEQWLWRAAALASIFSMLIFIQFEKVVLRWGGPLTMVSLASPAVYLLSRIVMIGGVFAAFRASDPAIYDTYVVSTYWIHVL